ncbi:BAG family molecular chaperone regulator 4-like [Cicer arietinum]|uniref:BAG family molecular chaperone regulator 4-like n=1 Tax=Cicer arietinum TaxID=3827 RepID=A0A1S2YLL4_CICAR|nr:BAG family molecular chaperone regulator 4-like [Cicer arietinum]
MNNPLDTAGASPPAQSVIISPDAKPGSTSESDGVGGPTIKINVSYGSSLHVIHLPAQSTFGDIKKLLVHKTGLEPEEQRLFFRGIEKGDNEKLHLEGVKDKSKLLLMERAASKEKKLEETRKLNEISKASEAINVVKAEVDKLSDKVAALEMAINAGNKSSEKELLVLTELLMGQLLKLDGVEAEGEAKLQRKAEVRRVQGLVDLLDSLKARNSNPFSQSGNAVTETTHQETFDNGTEGSNDPSSTTTSSSTKISQDWERFD